MRLYNSLTQKQENFKPLNDKEVKLYVCGITPYDTTHLGHAFTYMAFDVLQRFLTFQGNTVTYTQNVTDVDDDLLKRAKETNKFWKELGEFWTQRFLNDFETLGIILPTHYVKATDSIPTMLKIIEKLEKDGLAYEKEGNVYFRVTKDSEYGKLSRLSREEMITLSKERGADPDDPRKENPLDFILWQKSKEGEPHWESKFGNGRPGWHIECSAMIYDYLGEQIDIHGGGSDLMYPHHESEIAQSETFTGKKPLSQFFLHTGTVGYKSEKMSKSLGNLIMVSDLLKKYDPNAIKYFLLTHHYRSDWEYNENDLENSQKEMQEIKKAIKITVKEKGEEEEETTKQFILSLEDDLNTPKALSILAETAAKQQEKPTRNRQKALQEMSMFFGFNFNT